MFLKYEISYLMTRQKFISKKKRKMSTIHFYLNNVGSSRVILRSPLIYLCEQWREWSQSKIPIIIATQSQIGYLDSVSKDFLFYPTKTHKSRELIAFLSHRGKEIVEKSDFENLTLFNLSFTVPWIKFKNPPSIGVNNEKGGIVQIVEIFPYNLKYLQFNSKIINRISEWRQKSGFFDVILIWTQCDSNTEKNSSTVFHRLLWPQEEKYSKKLIDFVKEDVNFQNSFTQAVNIGFFADLWGNIENVTCTFQHLENEIFAF